MKRYEMSGTCDHGVEPLEHKNGEWVRFEDIPPVNVKEYRRLVELVMNEWGKTEQEVLAWIRDDEYWA